jgi:hypothetical protein
MIIVTYLSRVIFLAVDYRSSIALVDFSANKDRFVINLLRFSFKNLIEFIFNFKVVLIFKFLNLYAQLVSLWGAYASGRRTSR